MKMVNQWVIIHRLWLLRNNTGDARRPAHTSSLLNTRENLIHTRQTH